MSDVAVLGLAIDSRPVVAATSALDKFAASAKPAAQAAATLEKAAAGAAKGAKDITAAGGLARFELVNLSRQIQDVGVSLAGGQSPFTVLFQQGSQIADIFSSSKTASVGGAIKQVAGGITGFLTPARALGLGVGAIAAAAYVAYSSWKSFALQLDDTAKSVGTTTTELSKLQAAGSVKGIGGDDFTKGITSFGQQVYLAKNNMGGLADVFRANNAHAATFDGYLEKAADLIKNAKDDQTRLVLLQQMGLPATMDWVRLLSGGADGLRKAKDAMTAFATDDSAVWKAREFDEVWNKAWTNFGTNARSAFQTALNGGSSFFGRMEKLAQNAGNADFWKLFYNADSMKSAGVTPISQFSQRFAGDSPNPASGNSTLSDALRQRADQIRNGSTVDPQGLQHEIALAQPRLGLLGQTASVQQLNARPPSENKEVNHDSDQRRRAA